MQTRYQSFIEASTGTLVGGVGSWVITYWVLWLAEHYGVADQKKLVALCTVSACTVWSLIRGYWLRRRFNRLHAVSSAKAETALD